MSCPDLCQPDNGTIECAFGDDGVASYQDTCRFSCVEGYRLSGSTSRTCQSDGTWSGSSATCRRGKLHLVMYSPNLSSHPIPISFANLHTSTNTHTHTQNTKNTEHAQTQ